MVAIMLLLNSIREKVGLTSLLLISHVNVLEDRGERKAIH